MKGCRCLHKIRKGQEPERSCGQRTCVTCITADPDVPGAPNTVYLCSLRNDNSLFNMARWSLWKMWFPVCRWMETIEIYSWIGRYWGMMVVRVIGPAVRHKNVICRVFPWWDFSKKVLLGTTRGHYVSSAGRGASWVTQWLGKARCRWIQSQFKVW